MITGVLAIVITLVLVIGLHEAGHALAAVLFRVKIQRISIGFGRPLLKWQGQKGPEWVWALWPLGGYVQLLNSRIQPVSEASFPDCFDKKPIWVRCVILLAGALANVLLAWMAFTVLFMVGYKQTPPIVANVIPGSLMASAGIQAGDRVAAVNGRRTHSWQSVGMALIREFGQPGVHITVLRAQDARHEVTVDLSNWKYPRGKGSLLALMGLEVQSPSIRPQWVAGVALHKAAWLAIIKIGDQLFQYIIILKQLVTGMIPFSLLLGPVGLFGATWSSFVHGLSVFMYFIASLSLAVGLVNLFPFPGLDGGLLVYALVEKVRGKPISVALEVLLHQLAVIVFCLLFVQLILNDLVRYLG
ncbi:M50 family metallopeptidase [Legionella spiritensis]|uniref:Membrane associated zinc metalloprotease n=1 Tax=Legionella spiritensis TaxID=452 RepID=A0A0W0ZAF8_LEGSP|nr:site-2 protease family protein [Legionella spiritensis]KTD66107.1 membrane associated zinc metalloprotease [Legionella spiritensis]SNV44142.1 membrane associated zinc metalloprotease [Legionella spiritensis]